MANGLCDNLLTCIFRAWDFTKPVLLAPAMNTKMWQSYWTPKHLDLLRGSPFNCQVIGPIHQMLACGEIGCGAMTKPVEILLKVQETLPSEEVLMQMRIAQ
eukprot:TRINITY_DN727_c0_g1_i3.p1 TRINITY_DN727_c0_g1~~TRINITY_DN727_c0_g1_i3.p1  ORF type:complete len:101 (+),score=14.79 TRINITY_DN727_c0_g1_i3:444-746(+)